ncbi:DUF2927 domain-containing protein [Stappia sp. GBMRC 2046]|uniref:DUF2927 domain-containing protein n=1 Tax=Stappia sediminis TaxID=2692190 RepID=A0A7X3LW73_9HYPH|nr:DUF2927 domain-containing protein [Stappia sediminis]MXN66186.1 DUF2927 domain-containing protein [Stappia sediminis]
MPNGKTPLLRLLILLALFVASVPAAPAVAASANYSFSTEELIDGFMKTVFGLEYRAWSWQPYLVKKYTGTVSFYVHNEARKNRKPVIHQFIRQLNSQIHGLSTRVTRDPDEANFHVHVVDRDQYEDVVRRDVYGDHRADVPGRCLVRVVSDGKGISRSTAVIVSDEGDFLFRRCLVEELLQGLGPMNDDAELAHSVFNDRSRHSRFTTFDKFLLNMLYHPRIKPGMTQDQVAVLLPAIVREVRRYVH